MPTIFIDNRPYAVDDGQNLLKACLSLGFDLPYFCWHPAMHSVGACRQCAVKLFRDEHDTAGRIVMSCMTPVKDGMRLSVSDPEAVAFRKSVIEWLMVNHPHDCPVCDEGGECHLQDMTVMTGHNYRRHRFKKRTYRNQDLGPLVNHEMNRCIQCYRCVRFYCDYAGGKDFGVFGWHDSVYFGRSGDGPLENEFSGNLVEICPTGVFTDKTLKKHYTRKWDLQTAPSICVHCGLGCNTIPAERYGDLRRVYNRFNSHVNGYFLCDRGRYGYEFVNSPLRIRTAMMRDAEGQLSPCTAQAALAQVSQWTAGGKAIGIGSPRASLEANYALRKLVGKDRFFGGMSMLQQRLADASMGAYASRHVKAASLQHVARSDAALVLGEDATQTAPMLGYYLRQMIRTKGYHLADELKIDRWNEYPVRDVSQHDRSPLFVVSPMATKLDELAASAVRMAPDDIARLGFAVANRLGDGPAVELPQAQSQLADQISAALRAAVRPVVVSGIGCGSVAVIQAAAAVAAALGRLHSRPCDLCLTAGECNSTGLAMMQPRSLLEACEAVGRGEATTLVVLENDLYRRGEKDAIDALLGAAANVVVLDHTASPTTRKAHVLLPAGTFAEADGTLVNNEGRAQRFYQVFMPEGGQVQESWRWLRDVMNFRVEAQAPQASAGAATSAGAKAGDSRLATGDWLWNGLDDVAMEMGHWMPQFVLISEMAPPAGYRVIGQRVPRQPHRYSGRTAMTADKTMHEPPPPTDADSALGFTMEGFHEQVPSPLLTRYWAPGWNSVQALNKFQHEVGGPLREDEPGAHLFQERPIETHARGVGGAGGDFGRVAGGVAGVSPARHAGILPAFSPRAAQWLVVPAHHIFGSDEMSVLSPGIKELAPQPYVAINLDAARRAGVFEGQDVELTIGNHKLQLPVRIRPELPDGLVAMPQGLPSLPHIDLPAWGCLAGSIDARREVQP